MQTKKLIDIQTQLSEFSTRRLIIEVCNRLSAKNNISKNLAKIFDELSAWLGTEETI